MEVCIFISRSLIPDDQLKTIKIQTAFKCVAGIYKYFLSFILSLLSRWFCLEKEILSCPAFATAKTAKETFSGVFLKKKKIKNISVFPKWDHNSSFSHWIYVYPLTPQWPLMWQLMLKDNNGNRLLRNSLLFLKNY